MCLVFSPPSEAQSTRLLCRGYQRGSYTKNFRKTSKDAVNHTLPAPGSGAGTTLHACQSCDPRRVYRGAGVPGARSPRSWRRVSDTCSWKAGADDSRPHRLTSGPSAGRLHSPQPATSRRGRHAGIWITNFVSAKTTILELFLMQVFQECKCAAPPNQCTRCNSLLPNEESQSSCVTADPY